MWPKATTSDLLSSYDAKVYIHNLFIKQMKGLKEEIAVSHFTLLVLGHTYSYLGRQLLGWYQ